MHNKFSLNFFNFNKNSINVIVFFVFFALCSSLFSFPIMASDEYAYYISGKYLQNLSDLHILDSGLQNLDNYLYFALINKWVNFFGDNFVTSFRLLQNIFYCSTAIILYKTFQNISSKKYLNLSILGFLLIPNSFYIYTIMPEVFLTLLMAIVGYLIIQVSPKFPHLAYSLSGFCVALAQFVKPHAIAIFLAILLTIVIFYLIALNKNNFINGLKSVIIYCMTYYLTIVIFWRLLVGDWIIDISLTLGLKTYGQYLQTGNQIENLLYKIIDALNYAGVQLAVIGLMFAPVLVWLVTHLRGFNGNSMVTACKECANTAHIRISIFITILMVTHIAMTAWFSAGVALLSGASESMRIHGRYLGPVLIFMPFLFFLSIENLSKKAIAFVYFVLMGSAVLCFSYYFKIFKIYPWDYPILFAFYQFPNHYSWDYSGIFSRSLTYVLYVFVILLLIALFYEKYRKKILALQFFIFTILGTIQTYGWVSDHLKSNFSASKDAQIISGLVKSNNLGDGVFISPDRYGRTSYVLFNLNNSPKVIVKKINETITESDISNVNWVLVDGEYNINFKFSSYLKISDFKIFLLDATSTAVVSKN